MTAAYHYKIGLTYGGMTNVEDLGVPLPAPKGSFKPFVDQIRLGSGTVRGVGFPSAIWHWGFLTRAQRDQLRVFCPGASQAIFIRTRLNEAADTYADFQGVMIWPPEEEKDTGRRLDFSINFTYLVGILPE